MGIWKWIKRLFGAKDPIQTTPVIKPDPVAAATPVTMAQAPVMEPVIPVVVPQAAKAEPVTVPKEPELKVEAATVAPEPVDPHPPMKMGDYDYVWNPAGGSGGQYEIYVSPEETKRLAEERRAAARAQPHGIGISRLPNGAIYMGHNRYGLPTSSQQHVYAEAMSLWKSGADPAKLQLILSRLVEPYVFDAAVYPDLHALVMYYLTNHSIPAYTGK